MSATPEQKKEIVNLVLHEFILYQNRIELRYRLPVTPEQVAETLHGCPQNGERTLPWQGSFSP